MKFSFEFHRDAEDEFLESYIWYEEGKDGLGDQFFDEVERKLQLITQKPEMFPFDEFPIRKAILKKFPFTIFYEFNAASKRIYVVGIFHSKRNPQVLKKRI